MLTCACSNLITSSCLFTDPEYAIVEPDAEDEDAAAAAQAAAGGGGRRRFRLHSDC